MGIFHTLLSWLRGHPREVAPDGFEALNRHAPLRDKAAPQLQETPGTPPGTLLCREAVLGRNQRIAGYRFLLRESTRNRIRRSSRVVHHVYAEVLVGSLVQADLIRLLEHRLAFVEVPDSFLDHASLRRLPAGNLVIVATPLEDDTPPDAATLIRHITDLRAAGYRFGSHAHARNGVPPEVRNLIDFIIVSSQDHDPAEAGQLASSQNDTSGGPAVVAVDIATLDDFHFFEALGVNYFHGPFISSREEWKARELGPDLMHARPLLEALQRDAPNEEIVELTKHNPTIALRLLRYVNSAAGGLERDVESIEQALHIAGRRRLVRWVMMVLFGDHPDTGRSSAALESALIRARMMELLGDEHDGEAETLFLVGLLSLVDVVMQVDRTHALDALAVSDQIRHAVVDGSGPHANALALAIALEHGHTDEIERAAEACSISTEKAAALHIQALCWALETN